MFKTFDLVPESHNPSARRDVHRFGRRQSADPRLNAQSNLHGQRGLGNCTEQQRDSVGRHLRADPVAANSRRFHLSHLFGSIAVLVQKTTARIIDNTTFRTTNFHHDSFISLPLYKSYLYININISIS